MDDTKVLLDKAANGDADAWNQLVEDHHSVVWATARGLGLSKDQAADASQTVWLRLVENLETVPRELADWLVATTRDESLRIIATPQWRWLTGLAQLLSETGVRTIGGGVNRAFTGWLTTLAVALAGSRRKTLRDEWRSHLAGEHGVLTGRRRVQASIGFVVAAVRLRFQDVLDLAWRPIDGILRSRTLSNMIVWIPTTVAGRVVVSREGSCGLVFFAHELVAVAGVFFGLIRVGRWWRGVAPVKDPKPKSPAVDCAALLVDTDLPQNVDPAGGQRAEARPVQKDVVRAHEPVILPLLKKLPEGEQEVVLLSALMPPGRDDLIARALAVTADEVGPMRSSALEHLRTLAVPPLDHDSTE